MLGMATLQRLVTLSLSPVLLCIQPAPSLFSYTLPNLPLQPHCRYVLKQLT